jgi:predicted ATP-dependent serine protease
MCKGCVEDSDEELETALACRMGVECSYSGIHVMGGLRVVDPIPGLAIVTAIRSKYIMVKGLDGMAHPNKYI